MRDKFWTLPLSELNHEEWEALCDGCGKCCLNKIEFEDTGELAFTRIACKLLDGDSCQCSHYEDRHRYVPECIVLTRKKLKEVGYWLPSTCAYRLRAEGKPLFDWHYLISGSHETVHEAGVSVRGWTVNELLVNEDDWEQYVIEDQT